MTARSRISGALDQAALARLHFTALSQAEQAAAIRRLAASSMSANGIATATSLSIAQIRRVLAEAERTA
jgi:DNA invertase Pin-like site-specific DNA recombinase